MRNTVYIERIGQKPALANIKPSPKLVFVALDKTAGKTEGGIIVQESSRVDMTTGTVVAVGPDTNIVVGASVYFTTFAGTECKGWYLEDDAELPVEDRRTVKMLRQSEILSQMTFVE